MIRRPTIIVVAAMVEHGVSAIVISSPYGAVAGTFGA